MSDKAPFKKRIGWRLQVFAYDLVCLLLKPFSFDQISRFGGWLLRKIGPRTSKQRIIETGLDIAFPDLSEDKKAKLITEIWDNTGRTFAEFPILSRVKVFDENSRVIVHGKEHLDAIAASGTGAVLISGHFANWEVMAAVLCQSGLPVRVTYRPLNNPHLNRRVIEQREAYGIKFLVQKSAHIGARALLKALSKGESIAILNDQKFNQGLSVPFFGQPAMTASGAVRIALKTGAPIVPTSVIRKGAHFEFTCHPPLVLEQSGDLDADLRGGVMQIIRFTEDWVKTNPAQWFWVHRRWPKELYKKR